MPPELPRKSTSNRTWLMTSVAEWIVSANSVGEPVVTNAKNFEPVMMLLVAIGTATDFDNAVPLEALRHSAALDHLSFTARGERGLRTAVSLNTSVELRRPLGWDCRPRRRASQPNGA